MGHPHPGGPPLHTREVAGSNPAAPMNDHRRYAPAGLAPIGYKRRDRPRAQQLARLTGVDMVIHRLAIRESLFGHLAGLVFPACREKYAGLQEQGLDAGMRPLHLVDVLARGDYCCFCGIDVPARELDPRTCASVTVLCVEI